MHWVSKYFCFFIHPCEKKGRLHPRWRVSFSLIDTFTIKLRFWSVMTFAFGLLNYAVRLLHSLLIFTLPINFPLWRNLSQMRPRYFNDFTECFDVLCHFESRYSLITQRHKDTKTVEVIYGSSIHDLYITQMVFEKVLLDWMASSRKFRATDQPSNKLYHSYVLS